MARRALVALLCAAMVFSSESFTVAAMTVPAAEEQTEEIAPVAPETGDEDVIPDEGTGSDEKLGSDEEPGTEENEDSNSEEPGEPGIEAGDENDGNLENNEGENNENENNEDANSDGEQDLLATATPFAEEEPPADLQTLFWVTTTGELRLNPNMSLTAEVEIPKEAVIIPAGLFNTAENAAILTKVTFEADSLLTTINDEAFKNCSKLKSFAWQTTLTSIGESAFENSGLTELNLSGLTALTTIGKSAFEGSSIETVKLPACITAMEGAVFKDCASLTGISQGESAAVGTLGTVTSIGKEALKGTKIQKINAEKLITIGQSAFAGCRQLSLFARSDTLETIEAGAFQDCTALNTGFKWSKNIKVIGRNAFSNCGFEKLSLDEIESADITIQAGAFSGCSALTKVESMPEHLAAIPASMFENCSKLSSVTLTYNPPNNNRSNVTEIGEKAFAGCKAITEIKIPETVTAVRAKAFDECTGLKTVIILNENPVGDGFILEAGAFPRIGTTSDKDKPVMKGYDGKVQEYAEQYGYKFETLYDEFSIVYDSKTAEHIKVTRSHTKAREGTIITLTFEPSEEYTLAEGSVRLKCDKASPQVELVTYTDTSIQYRFKMPNCSVEVICAEQKLDQAIIGDIAVTVEPELEKKNDVLHFSEAGQEAQLVVTDRGGASTGKAVGAWLLNFSSSDKSVVSVSNQGKLLAKKKGTATITVSKKSDESKKAAIKVAVDSSITINLLELDSLEDISRATIIPSTLDGKPCPIIQFNKATLSNSEIKFDVSFKAYKSEDNKSKNYKVTSTWKSVDTGVASVKSSSSDTNSNTITVKKKALGESLITITVQKSPDSTDKITQSILIRVIDVTPRLADSKIVVNAASEIGTQIDVVTVYGAAYDINTDKEFHVCEVKEKNGKESFVDFTGLAVDYNPTTGTCYLKATDNLTIANGAKKTYDGKLYLCGMLKDGSEFEVKIPMLVIENKTLNPTIKMTGKINLFYIPDPYAGTDANAGEVKVTQSLTKETVTDVKLMSAENYAKAIKNETIDESNDKFIKNFDISLVDNKTFLITRTINELEKDENDKAVVSGYLAVKYAGYKQPIYKKITVPNMKKKPAYVLTMTSATANTRNANQTYMLQIKNKTTKKIVDLTGVTNLNLFGGTSNATTPGVFRALTPASVTSMPGETTPNVIPLTVDGYSKSGKAVINVKLSTWSEPMRFTFKLKVTSALPKAKMAPAVLTLNTLCPDQEAKVTVQVNQKAGQEQATLTGFEDLTYVSGPSEDGKPVVYTDEDSIYAKLPAEPVPGTYKYTVKPIGKFAVDADTATLSTITFKVVVKDAQPSIKLKKNTFVLNALYPGKEEAKLAYKLVNLPEGGTPVFDTTEMELRNNSGFSADEVLSSEKLTFDTAGGVMIAKLKNTQFPNSFTQEYTVSKLKVSFGPGKVVTLQDFKIKVRGNRTEPKVKLKAKGTLNPVDPNSEIVYTAVVSGMGSTLENSISMYEYDENGEAYLDGGVEVSKHFTAALDPETNKIHVKVKPAAVSGEALKAGKAYDIVLLVRLEAMTDGTVLKLPLTIKPKQTLPKVKADKKDMYFYAGQNRAKTVEIQLENTGKKATDAAITEVVFAEGTSDNIKQAFTIRPFDAVRGVMTLELTNSTSLKLDQKYSINFEVKYAEQMTKTKGVNLKLDVTVRK